MWPSWHRRRRRHPTTPLKQDSGLRAVTIHVPHDRRDMVDVHCGFFFLSPFRFWFREARSQLKLPFPLDLTRLSLSLIRLGPARERETCSSSVANRFGRAQMAPTHADGANIDPIPQARFFFFFFFFFLSFLPLLATERAHQPFIPEALSGRAQTEGYRSN